MSVVSCQWLVGAKNFSPKLENEILRRTMCVFFSHNVNVLDNCDLCGSWLDIFDCFPKKMVPKSEIEKKIVYLQNQYYNTDIC